MTPSKRIVYFAPARPDGSALLAELRGVSQAEFVAATAPANAIELLDRLYVHALIVDLRADPRAGLRLLDRLDDTEDVEARYGFHRIVCVVSDHDGDQVDALLVELGSRGVRHSVRERATEPTIDLARRLDRRCAELIAQRRHGKRALCAAGGGITGIYFELGALKCLDDCLGTNSTNAFDMYFGISAGAVVTSLLASGYSTDEIMAAIAGVEGGRIAPLDLRLARLDHLNYPELARHLRKGISSTARELWTWLSCRGKASLSSLFLQLADSVGPPFHADRFESMLRDALNRPGATNDFRKLPRPLFVGATDQDARQHVLFGSETQLDMPISQAVQASLSINPAFTSVEINNRFYEDGAVTRTSNFIEAIRRDATLVFIVDPFVPYVSKDPGVAHKRGLLYNADQNIRAISYTRFENARSWVLRKHPDVSSYTFLPSNTLRRVLSLSPMDHRPYLEIWRGAYLSTLQRIHHLAHRMRGDLSAHDIRLDTSRADAVADQLRATSRPTFADFFVDHRIELSQPRLCCHDDDEPAIALAGA